MKQLINPIDLLYRFDSVDYSKININQNAYKSYAESNKFSKKIIFMKIIFPYMISLSKMYFKLKTSRTLVINIYEKYF